MTYRNRARVIVETATPLTGTFFSQNKDLCFKLKKW